MANRKKNINKKKEQKYFPETQKPCKKKIQTGMCPVLSSVSYDSFNTCLWCVSLSQATQFLVPSPLQTPATTKCN